MNFEAAREIMVDSQIRPNDVSDPEFVHAFLNTPREAFVPATRKPVAYSELEIETSEGRALWTPRDTAKLLKSAGIQPTDIVLVIGAGAGLRDGSDQPPLRNGDRAGRKRRAGGCHV